MQITVKVIDGQVRRGIRNVADAIPQSGFRVLWRLFQNAIARLKNYPPEPAGSTYIRTGTYGNSFEAVKLGAGTAGVRLESDAVQNGVHYTTLVGGDSMGMGQAEVHSGRWELISDVVDQEVTQQVSAEAEADLQKVVIQQGMGL